MNPTIKLMIQAAINAEKIIIRGFLSSGQITTIEKSGNDYTTHSDLKAEKAIFNILNKSYPSYNFFFVKKVG